MVVCMRASRTNVIIDAQNKSPVADTKTRTHETSLDHRCHGPSGDRCRSRRNQCAGAWSWGSPSSCGYTVKRVDHDHQVLRSRVADITEE
jgi:hypothetical protein